jgi:hypothetical protein
MDTMNHISDLTEDRVRGFRGFLTALLYSGMDDPMQEFLRQRWGTLNIWSGNSLLILVPRLTPDNDANDELATVLSRRFEVTLANFPALVFFNDTASTAGEVFSFSKEESLGEIFKGLFSHCIAVRDEYSRQLATGSSLEAVRTNMLDTLRPRLQQDKVIRLVKKIVTPSTVYKAAKVGIDLAKMGT